ncbi:hypothetical protein EDB87DRAFT_901805 [Lactarius vividus]|nr:hypothetical protein EDB87DRAFT_901805 [Lactarius vividus]
MAIPASRFAASVALCHVQYTESWHNGWKQPGTALRRLQCEFNYEQYKNHPPSPPQYNSLTSLESKRPHLIRLKQAQFLVLMASIPLAPTVRLNNYLQSIGRLGSVSYTERDNGPSANPENRWTVTVKIDGQEMATCFGPRKSMTKEAAVEQALRRLGIP